MANVVGLKGQVVIRKDLRDRLGVGPGWKATQRIVDGHLELHFIPPAHNRSLAGILRPLIDSHGPAPTDEEIDEAIEAGFAQEFREEEARIHADCNAKERT